MSRWIRPRSKQLLNGVLRIFSQQILCSSSIGRKQMGQQDHSKISLVILEEILTVEWRRSEPEHGRLRMTLRDSTFCLADLVNRRSGTVLPSSSIKQRRGRVVCGFLTACSDTTVPISSPRSEGRQRGRGTRGGRRTFRCQRDEVGRS